MLATNQYKIIIDFMRDLESTNSFDKCFKLLTEQAKISGFDGALYTYQPMITRNVKPIILISPDYGTDFLNHYLDKKLDQHDFVVQHALERKIRVFNWQDYVQSEKRVISEAEVNVMREAEKFGIKNGISLVFDSSMSRFSCASFICRKDNDYFQEHCVPNIDYLQIISELFHNNVIKKNFHHAYFISPVINNVNQTKQNVIKALALGKNTKSIACDLNVSNKYIQNLVTEIRKDFDCKSRDELMYLLGSLEIIS